MKDIIIQTLLPAVATILSGFTSWAMIAIKKYISSKTKNELVNSALERVTHTVESTVAALSQTMVTSIKEKSDDGKLTSNEIQMIKNEALNTVMKQLPDAIKEAAKLGTTNLESFISAKIEQAVLKQKAASPVSLIAISGEAPATETKQTVQEDPVQPIADPTQGGPQTTVEDIAKQLFSLVQQSKPETVVNPG